MNTSGFKIVTVHWTLTRIRCAKYNFQSQTDTNLFEKWNSSHIKDTGVRLLNPYTGIE